MLTCCPACRTCFRITEAQLTMAQGKVRCGKCKTVFNAKLHLQTPAGQPASAAPEKTLPPATADDTDHIDLAAAPAAEPTSEARPESGAEPAAESERRFKAKSESRPQREAKPEQKPKQEQKPKPEPEPEPEPEEPQESRYKYNDFTDEVFSQHELDDILAEMDQQLSQGIDSPGPELSDPLVMPDASARSTDKIKDELGETIDTLFDDLRREEASVDEIPEVDEASTETHEQASDSDVRNSDETTLSDVSQTERQSKETGDTDEADETTSPADETVPLRLRDSLAIQPPKRRSWLATLGGSLLILLLLVALAGQLILFRPLDVYRLLPRSKPYIEQLCQHLPCQFNTHRDPTQIRLINRDVRAHPDQPDALLITAALVNQADYRQAYPDLRVTLFDLSGNRVSRRRFTPGDYLGNRYSPFMLMEPGTPLHIKLEVVDPGSDAVNFEFDFQ